MELQEASGLWACDQCGREFVDEESLKLHSSLHRSGEEGFTEAEILLRRELLYKEVRRQEDEASGRQTLHETPPPKPRRIYRPPSKRVGLTKIRLEDCLRCDACSCIYIDERDYYKHMRNFHQKYNTVIPRSRRRSPIHHKCSVNYTDAHQQEKRATEEEDVKPSLESLQSSLNLFLKEKIKNRWSKVSQRLSSQLSRDFQELSSQENQVKIKEEPLDDMDYLLSQVEVKIKTEPPEI